MASILAWIVAVECHAAPPGKRNSLDFKAPVSLRALEWAEWLRDRAEVELLMNVSATPGSDEAARVDTLRPRLLNGAEAHRADAASLRASLGKLARTPPADVLLLLWIGHGVMNNRQRYLLTQDTEDLENLQSWDLDSLLQHLRSARMPPLQIGAIDSCAQVISDRPGNVQLSGTGKTSRLQHFYFSSTAAAIASLNPFEPTLASMALDVLKAIEWPPSPRPLDALLMDRVAGLASRPVRFEWTQGSGDQWSSRFGSGDDDRAMAANARRAQLSEVLFRHLWLDLASTGETPAALAKAIRGDTLEALAKKIEGNAPDAPEPDLLRDAWDRVKLVQQWAPRLATLGLSVPQWTELARHLANEDARHAPQFAELRELLLWSLDMNRDVTRNQGRAHAALLRLMLMAMNQAAEPGAPARSTDAAARLDAELKADPLMAPLLAAVQPTADLPKGSVVIYIELEHRANALEPSVQRYWLLRDSVIEPGADLELEGPMGEQLNTLINHVQRDEARPVRVELLAPFLLLCGQREWLSYSVDIGELTGNPADTGAALQRVELDAVWPICWRWKERLQGKEAKLQPALWQQRGRQAQERARASEQLHCRFDDEQRAAGEDEAHVLGLIYLPPSPSQRGRNLGKFFKHLIDGEPYMVWPGAEPDDAAAFKNTVRAWLAGQRLNKLPEALCQARSGSKLPELVLFLDEPDRNPYAQTQRLQTLGTAPT
ncbi:hypothetical protein H6CHR_00136 [Variovorax sp. PBL-H6]|uniref:hypothetical protein n=1 Tax=Variovorax sp. PBL-H6 TaxID=434009 RepID=UPI001317C9B2|nr:hypothetical protein [Variovorax sp. PBL-H6]VTU15152.1 hypothetical protein H6CHR_00136 [Variovorax sp. PBL-H6]